jgi:hypothetical protein
VNDAYSRLIAHVATLEAIESESEQSATSVIIEVSKQSVPKWKTSLMLSYGVPRTTNVSNTIFEVQSNNMFMV